MSSDLKSFSSSFYQFEKDIPLNFCSMMGRSSSIRAGTYNRTCVVQIGDINNDAGIRQTSGKDQEIVQDGQLGNNNSALDCGCRPVQCDEIHNTDAENESDCEEAAAHNVILI